MKKDPALITKAEQSERDVRDAEKIIKAIADHLKNLDTIS
jgi:hypothetical protein